jgi:hypothetical protein
MSNRFIRISGFIAAIILATSNGASAGGPLATSFVSVTTAENIMCTVSNIGTSDAEVVVEALDSAGVVLAPIFNTCLAPPAVLAAGASCIQIQAAGADGYCRVTGKGKLRAALRTYDNVGFLTTGMLPATAK